MSYVNIFAEYIILFVLKQTVLCRVYQMKFFKNGKSAAITGLSRLFLL